MKKCLALLFVFSLVLSTLATGIVGSAEGTEKTYLEVDPAVIFGVGGSEGLQENFVADPSPLALGANKAFTVTTANNDIYNYWVDDTTDTADYAGMLMWVDGTNGAFGVNPQIVVQSGNSPMHVAAGGTYYLLRSGIWEAATAAYCKASVPAGFKGWLYIPFGAYGGGMPTGIVSYCRVYIDSKGDATGNSVTASIPMYVRAEGIGANGVPKYTAVALTGQEPPVDDGKDYLEVDPIVMSKYTANEGLQENFVADPSPLALGANKAFTVTTANNDIYNYWVDDTTDTADYAGMLMWVDGTNGAFGVNPQIVVQSGNSPMHVAAGGTYYLLRSGIWEAATAAYCKASVPAGFKGWLYIPFGAYGGGMPTGIVSYCRVYIDSKGDATGNSVTASIPMYVRAEGIGANGVPKYTAVALTGQEPPVDDGKDYLEVDPIVMSNLSLDYGLEDYFVADPSPLALGANRAFTLTTANESVYNCWYDDATAAAPYSGVLMWVDGTNGSFGVDPMIVAVTGGNSPMHVAEGGTYYLLRNGAWEAATSKYAKAPVPAGFKGWLYIPFSAYYGGMPTGTISYCFLYIDSVGDEVGNTVTASIPMYVRKKGVDMNGMPRFNKIALTGYRPISESDYDLFEDGFVNSKDLVTLKGMLLNGNGVDLNGDSVCDIKDLIRMKKFIAARAS